MGGGAKREEKKGKMNTQMESAGRRGWMLGWPSRHRRRGSRGFGASFSTADSARPPTRAGPRRPSLPCHSPVVDLQDSEPCVLGELFLLLLRGVRVLWPSARVTLLPGCPLIPRPGPPRSPGRGGMGWRAQAGPEPGESAMSELLRAPGSPMEGSRAKLLAIRPWAPPPLPAIRG